MQRTHQGCTAPPNLQFCCRTCIVSEVASRIDFSAARAQILLNLTPKSDASTKEHCERVAHNSLLLGRALGLSEPQLEPLYWSALLHDLGKIAVPERILLKPGTLTAEEYSQIKRHAAYGAELLESISPDLAPIADPARKLQDYRAHHERWDGAGYPLGLSGESIPLLSRIIAIVDAFEALTSARPYRRAMSAELALTRIIEGASSHFDPRLVALFEGLHREGHLSFAPLAKSLTAPSGTAATDAPRLPGEAF